nr:EH signature domain-containing protein [Planctomonas sp. JC2975]
MSSRRYARALVGLWCETDGDCCDSISPTLLTALHKAHPFPSPLLTQLLEAVYFDRFDELDELGLIEEDISAHEHDCVELAGPSIRARLAGILATAWGNSGYRDETTIEVLTAEDSPRRVASDIRARDLAPATALATWDIDAYDGGRFVRLVRQYLFLERLRALKIGADDDVLVEIRQPEVRDAPHVRGQTLGHAALAILIDRADTYPGSVWRDVVLDIASDPRMTASASHQRWWSVLGDHRRDKVIGWLAAAELSVFLEVLTHFAQQDSDDTMRRLLPPRKQFLEGLLQLGVVRRSRLFLGDEVRLYVSRHTPATRTWDWARLDDDKRRALLYLDCGDFHLIEGSHNTKLWLYLAHPGEAITDPRRHSFMYRALTRALADRFQLAWQSKAAAGETSTGFRDVVHKGLWQGSALEFLADAGIRVDPQAVLNASDYQDLRQKRGLPVVRARRAA